MESDDKVEAPTGIAAVVRSGYDTPAIRVTWIEQAGSLTQLVRYREVGKSSWTIRVIANDQSKLLLTDLRDGVTIEIQVANRTAAFRMSEWGPEDPTEITAIRNSEAPVGLKSFTATDTGGGVVEAVTKAASVAGFDSVRIYRATYATGYAGST